MQLVTSYFADNTIYIVKTSIKLEKNNTKIIEATKEKRVEIIKNTKNIYLFTSNLLFKSLIVSIIILDDFLWNRNIFFQLIFKLN